MSPADGTVRRITRRVGGDTVAGLRARLDEQSAVLAEQGRLISELRSRGEHQHQLDALGAHVESLYELVTRHEAQLTNHTDQFFELRAKVAALHNALAEVQRRELGPHVDSSQ